MMIATWGSKVDLFLYNWYDARHQSDCLARRHDTPHVGNLCIEKGANAPQPIQRNTISFFLSSSGIPRGIHKVRSWWCMSELDVVVVVECLEPTAARAFLI